MKFGRRLREQSDAFDAEALEHVVDYDQLKTLIKELRASKDAGQDISDGMQDWLRQFNVQVQRFDTFFCGRMEELRESVDMLCDGKGQKELAELKDLYVEIQELQFFGQMNRTGCRKILKKLDKNVGLTGTAGSHQERWKSGDMQRLAVGAVEEGVARMSARLADAYCAAQPARGLTTRRAQQELDYHVSCVSDLYAYMLSHADKPAAAADPARAPPMSPERAGAPDRAPAWHAAMGASPIRSASSDDSSSRGRPAGSVTTAATSRA